MYLTTYGRYKYRFLSRVSPISVITRHLLAVGGVLASHRIWPGDIFTPRKPRLLWLVPLSWPSVVSQNLFWAPFSDTVFYALLQRFISCYLCCLLVINLSELGGMP